EAFQERHKISPPADLNEVERKQFEKLFDANKKATKDRLTRGTNLGDSLVSVINKEINNRVQGIVVFTDGRNTEGSPNAFRELEQRAKSANIPIFVVGIGEDRQRVKIEIVDLRLPGQIQPEDKFRTVAELTGQRLAAKEVDITLEVTHVRLVKKTIPILDARGKPVIDSRTKKPKTETKEVEELLPLELIEQENKDDPKAVRIKIPLGNKLLLKPPTKVQF